MTCMHTYACKIWLIRPTRVCFSSYFLKVKHIFKAVARLKKYFMRASIIMKCIMICKAVHRNAMIHTGHWKIPTSPLTAAALFPFSAPRLNHEIAFESFKIKSRSDKKLFWRNATFFWMMEHNITGQSHARRRRRHHDYRFKQQQETRVCATLSELGFFVPVRVTISNFFFFFVRSSRKFKSLPRWKEPDRKKDN